MTTTTNGCSLLPKVQLPLNLQILARNKVGKTKLNSAWSQLDSKSDVRNEMSQQYTCAKKRPKRMSYLSLKKKLKRNTIKYGNLFCRLLIFTQKYFNKSQ